MWGSGQESTSGGLEGVFPIEGASERENMLHRPQAAVSKEAWRRMFGSARNSSL